MRGAVVALGAEGKCWRASLLLDGINVRIAEEDCGCRHCISADLVFSDAASSTLGELLSSLLLALPRIEGEGKAREAIDEALKSYVQRVFIDELGKLSKLFGESFCRTRFPVITPILSRMARLARVYPWLRAIYSGPLSSPSYYKKMYDIVVDALSERLGLRTGHYIYKPCDIGLEDLAPPAPQVVGGQASVMKVVAGLDLLSEIASPQLVAEGLSRKLHPLLRDPLSTVWLARGKHATTLLKFEDQLYMITGVKKALEEIKILKSVGVRSVSRLAVKGFVTAVVKDYNAPQAVKWLIASVLTLHLPRPRLSARKRLAAEYEYTLRVEEKGYNVHEPILVDFRRLRAAYRYIEGEDLASLLRRSPTPPQYRTLGSLFASLHNDGVALWDTNPSNFVYSPGRGELYLVDLEQARDLAGVEEAAWDLAVAIYYSALYSPRSTADRAKALLEGYVESGGRKEVIAEASKPKYMLPFIIAVSPATLESTRRVFTRFASEG